MSLKISCVLCFATAVWFCSALAGFAGSYPDRTIRIIVPAAAGGVLDVNARRIAEKLSRSLSQPVIVENRPGASGSLGTEAAVCLTYAGTEEVIR